MTAVQNQFEIDNALMKGLAIGLILGVLLTIGVYWLSPYITHCTANPPFFVKECIR